MSKLEEIIKTEIRENGPMDVGRFMSLALGHPAHGYYMKQDPLGAGGDFVTAPEISQLFGEMLGAWVADVWARMGSPKDIILLECGPGRGTLMGDMMRATKNVKGFHEALAVHLLEISPVLREKQGAALAEYKPQWHEALESVPGDAPLIVVGNEFLDALPFQQFVNGQERLIDLDDDGAFIFTLEGEIVERSPQRNEFIRDVCGRLKARHGAALFIDYGHVQSAAGDTFQALRNHEYVDVFSNVGAADLTSHVDFEALTAGVSACVCGPVTQGAFLKTLGIEARGAMLKSKADAAQAEALEKSLHRLTHSGQMGELFKVIGFTHDETITPAGF